jgi:uncharacterized Zn finger protein
LKLKKAGRLCSICLVHGHNSRTCPELNPQAAKNRSIRESKYKPLRRCSNCGSMKHNVRTCPVEL